MSLNIYSSPEKVSTSFKFIHDVEAEFEYIQLEDNETIRFLLQNIEKASYSNNVSYIDGAGFKRPKNLLSVGCKIAILATMLPNCVIDMCECRQIDRANVIAYCTTGNVLDVKKRTGYMDVSSRDINVLYDGSFFDKVYRLNNHIHRTYSEIKPGCITLNANPKILVNLDPGVYLIGEAAATNKNYLHNLFRKLGKEETTVGSFSYEDTVISDVPFMLNKGYKVILFNRADMYLDTPNLQLLKNYGANGIVLIDYKGEDLSVDDLKRVDIYTNKDRIEIALSYA